MDESLEIHASLSVITVGGVESDSTEPSYALKKFCKIPDLENEVSCGQNEAQKTQFTVFKPRLDPKLCHSYGFLTDRLFPQSLISIYNKRQTWNGESTKKITDHTLAKGRVLKIRKKNLNI